MNVTLEYIEQLRRALVAINAAISAVIRLTEREDLKFVEEEAILDGLNTGAHACQLAVACVRVGLCQRELAAALANHAYLTTPIITPGQGD